MAEAIYNSDEVAGVMAVSNAGDPDEPEMDVERPETADLWAATSAQAMLITALLRQPWQPDWQPSRVATALGYAPMTLWRAVKELTAAGLAAVHTVGRSRWLRTELPPEQVWKRAKPAMWTPVRRTVWVAAHGIAAHRASRLAGLSALAHSSMLTELKRPVFALTAADWKAAADAGVRESPEPDAV